MTNEMKQTINLRNQKLIDAVLKKIEVACPGSVDLIGVAGSFAIGDIHEKSYLDLLIVINDEKAHELSSCFIVEDVGFDFYCSRWDRLESMLAYEDPFCTKLLQLDIVYQKDDVCLERYTSLRETMKKRLDATFSVEDAARVNEQVGEAKRTFADVMLSASYEAAKYKSAMMVDCVNYALYMLNKRFVKGGIRRMLEEIRSFTSRPEHYLDLVNSLAEASTLEAIQLSSQRLMKHSLDYIAAQCESVLREKTLKQSHIKGMYEEIYSNWLNKMRLAAREGDLYLSWMTAASCQDWYTDVNGRLPIQRIEIMVDFDPTDLHATLAAFEEGMAKVKANYDQLGMPIVHYSSLEDFEKGYLAVGE
ncbi:MULTISPECIES: hypothetical protein [unclassified Fusibacter]|uniref:hypothetical protein n=1 Tax=unclassified Fusibacter TaxID=2624464 RepID=UPI0010118FBE|nr:MULTISPECIES: hypothetical protein [unclassified Fusibacter]MCK8058423.1 hypothetical protein [Fusibacter sp. A2]NPE22809.1 hypothetical protein [Fusibacter sp. A1]RXV60365.1 hypothetical protein DWB64_13265 [Fusibacter sp. A1]